MNERIQEQPARPRVLVVDDDAEMREMLSGVLEPAGYEVVLASGATDLRRQLRATPVNVVLLDVQLKDGDGFELLKSIKAAWPRTEVIVLSGHLDLDTMVEAGRLGAFCYEAKPFGVPDLLRTIRLACEASQGGRQTSPGGGAA